MKNYIRFARRASSSFLPSELPFSTQVPLGRFLAVDTIVSHTHCCSRLSPPERRSVPFLRCVDESACTATLAIAVNADLVSSRHLRHVDFSANFTCLSFTASPYAAYYRPIYCILDLLAMRNKARDASRACTRSYNHKGGHQPAPVV
jgi:hypothetical protein